jgi:hypothetical protein
MGTRSQAVVVTAIIVLCCLGLIATSPRGDLPIWVDRSPSSPDVVNPSWILADVELAGRVTAALLRVPLLELDAPSHIPLGQPQGVPELLRAAAALPTGARDADCDWVLSVAEIPERLYFVAEALEHAVNHVAALSTEASGKVSLLEPFTRATALVPPDASDGAVVMT